jgi:cell division protein FtsB
MEKKAKKPISLRKKILVAGLGFLFLVLLISSFFGKKGLIEIYRAKRNSKALVQEIEHLKEEKSRLEKEIVELERNPKAVEKEAREKLGLAKPDEKVIIKKNN